MPALGILEQLFVVLAASIPLSLLLRRLGQSTILAYLLTGLAIGPGGLGLIGRESIHALAEVGVALLLFAVGIEFSLEKLVRVRALAIGGGTLQVGGTAVLAGLAAYGVTGRGYEAVYLGCAAALSSSAILLKTLADRGDLDAPYASATIGVTIFQDLATVPMIVLLPVLGKGLAGGSPAVQLLLALAKAALLLALIWLAARSFVDRLLYLVARARSTEVFVLTVMTLLLGAALAAERAGLSIALGAFIAGLILSESEYSHQIFADVLPFKDVFQAIFFVSIGMLLDPVWVAANPGPVAIALSATVALKAVTGALALAAAGAPARVAAAAGTALAQVGEFSFVLVAIGHRAGVIQEETYQLALAASVATMAAAPPLISNVRSIVDALERLPWIGRALAGRGERTLGAAARGLSRHVVIGGFGPVGRDVAQFLLDSGVPFVVVELNPKTVREFREKGLEIFFGDLSNKVVLGEAGIARARALVVAMPDIEAARRAVSTARLLNPGLFIVSRTKYRAHVDSMLKSGANEVVEEEFETALELVVRLMRALDISRHVVTEQMASQRPEHYRLVPPEREAGTEGLQPLPPFVIETVEAKAGSVLAGRTIGEVRIRSTLGVTLLCISRGKENFVNPGPERRIEANDRLIFAGGESQVAAFRRLAREPGPP